MGIGTQLKQVVEERQTLSLAEAQALCRQILAGEATDVELAALLGAIAARGETSDEIAGFALAMREAATMLPLAADEREELVDTCGTGGDGSGTFNISTAAALVAAAAGVKVAKHGNRAVTSRCGSADVLEALGVPILLSPEAAVEALRAQNFCFMLAPAHHPGMGAVMPVRRALGVRTIFNAVGPLLNPAGARRQVMGVYAKRLTWPVAEAMMALGVHSALVVHGHGGLDELALSGPSEMVFVSGDESGGYSGAGSSIAPEQVGLLSAPVSTLAGGDAAENAAILRSIFSGEHGPRRDIVLLNAAAVLQVGGRADNIADGVSLARKTIDSGAILDLLNRLHG